MEFFFSDGGGIFVFVGWWDFFFSGEMEFFLKFFDFLKL